MVGRDGPGTRAKILAAIERDPGIHVSDLSDELDLAWTTVSHHIRVLQKSGEIEVAKEQRERRLFAKDLSPSQRAWLAALRDDDTAKVLKALLDAPNQGVADLGDELGVSHKVIRRHVSKLRTTGLAEKKGLLKPVFKPAEIAPQALEDRLSLSSAELIGATAEAALESAMARNPPKP